MAGSGYQVQVENLQEFARKVRGLLTEFEAGAKGDTVHAGSGVAAGAFGSFGEAQELDDAYGNMRDSLRDMLDILYQAVDDAQQNADTTARNYDDQEHTTASHMNSTEAAPPAATNAQSNQHW